MMPFLPDLRSAEGLFPHDDPQHTGGRSTGPDGWRNISAKEGQFLFQPLLGEIVSVPDLKNLQMVKNKKKNKH